MPKIKPLKSVLLVIAFKRFHSLGGNVSDVFRYLFVLIDIVVVNLKRLRALIGIVNNASKKPRKLKGIAVIVLVILGLAVTLAASFVFTHASPAYATSPPSTLNFQARLEDSSGAIVPDGDYNVEFKLYNVSTLGAVEWTEDYTYNSGSGSSDIRIHVANGYLSVNLGSQCPFTGGTCQGHSNTAINWDQQQYLTMNIGGTVSSGTITWDGEMSPRLPLTSVPYAFQTQNAEQLNELQGSATDSLQFATDTTYGNTITLPDLGGLASANESFGLMALQTSTNVQQAGGFNISGTGIAGSLEIAAAGALDTTAAGTLNIGTTYATSVLVGPSITLAGNASKSISLATPASGAGNNLTIQAATGASGNNNGGNLVLQGGAATGTGTGGIIIAKPQTNSTTAFQVQNASGTSILNVDTTNGRVGIGTATPNTQLEVAGGTYLGTQILTANDQSDVCLFGNSNCSAAQPGAYNSKLIIYGGNSQSRSLLVYQAASGNAYVDSTYGSLNLTTSNNNANVNLTPNGTGSIALSTGSSSSGTIVSTTTNSTTAFQVQNSSAAAVLDADTTNSRVGIGTATPDQTLQVNGVTDISGGGAPPASGVSGLGLGYDSGNYGWLQSYGSEPLLLNPVNNNVGIDTATTNARLQVNTNGAANIGQIIQGTTSQTADLFQAQNSSAGVLFNIASNGNVGIGLQTTNSSTVALDVNGAVQQVGLQTSYTGGTYAGEWTELGTCTITSQYNQCMALLSIVGGKSGNSSQNTQATVSVRVKQQNAFGSAPIVNVTLNNTAEVITNNDIAAVITQDTPTTIVNLYGEIPNSYEVWNYTATLDTGQGADSWTWTPTSGFSATLPSGIVAANQASSPAYAVYGDSYANTMLVETLGGNTTNAFQVQNASAGTVFSVDTTNNRVVIGAGVTGTVLVLGGSTSDPTETNGAMYYNTAAGSFRCGQFGYWANCSGLVASYTTTAGPEGGTAEHSFGQTWTAPQNDCQPGTVYHLIAGGWAISNTGGYTLYFNLQDTNVATSTTTDIRSESVKIGTNSTWTLNLYITCISTTTIVLSGNVYSEYSGGNASVFHTPSGGYSISNGASGDQYGLSVQWSSGPGTGNGAYEQTFIMERSGAP